MGAEITAARTATVTIGSWSTSVTVASDGGIEIENPVVRARQMLGPATPPTARAPAPAEPFRQSAALGTPTPIRWSSEL